MFSKIFSFFGLSSFSGIEVGGIGLIILAVGGLFGYTMILRADVRADLAQVQSVRSQCVADAKTAAADVSAHTAREMSVQQAAANSAYLTLEQKRQARAAQLSAADTSISGASSGNDPLTGPALLNLRQMLAGGSPK